MARAAVLVVVLAGCPAEYPGELVGTYAVTAELDASSCGPGAGDRSTRQFDVELRRDAPGVGWWIGPTGMPLPGTIDEQGNFAFRIEQRLLVRAADELAGIAPCVMDQVDDVTGTASGSLSGTESLFVAVASGADCSDQMGVAPGTFLQLPCEIRYVLEGETAE